MDFVALGARVLLSVVFITAAVGKATDQGGTRTALADFRVPDRFLRTLGLLLPVAEFAGAVLVLIQPLARFGAAVALVLLLAFIGAIAAALIRGEAPDCHCFGQISSSPAGWRTLLRNAAIAVPAVFVLAYGPGKDLDGWISSGSAAATLTIGLAIALTAAGATALSFWLRARGLTGELDQAQSTLSLFPPGLPMGSRAPSFALSTTDGGEETLETLLSRGRPLALVFGTPSCAPCRALLPEVARWQRTLSERMTIAVLTVGPADEIRAMAAEYGLRDVLMQRDGEVFKAYRAVASPSVVVVNPDGTIATRVRAGHGLVEGVIRHALHAEASEEAGRGPGPESLDDALVVSRWPGRRAVARVD